jgi:energy-coupling factor transport system substrate-specific component
MDGLSSQFNLEGWTLRFNSTQIAHVSTFIAIGAIARIGLDEIALVTPPLFGILIAVGLTETLTFIDGFVYGPTAGFVTGFLIILIADIFTQPGPWTPFIAAIIGLIGLVAGAMRRSDRMPTFRMLAVSAVLLTLMSELLQNAWVALFYSLPIAGVMTLGIVTLITALINNFILFTTLGPKVIKLLQGPAMKR